MRTRLSTSWLLLCCSILVPCSNSLHARDHIVIDAKAQTTPFPHFWEQNVRLRAHAILSLRDSYRQGPAHGEAEQPTSVGVRFQWNF